MKKILFFLFLLPAALASAQTAKDTVNVLTDAEISAGTLVDSVKMYYIQGNPAAWKKSRMDSLASYMVTKNGAGVITGDKGDITVNSATSWSIDAGAITTAKLAADAVDSTKISTSGIGRTDLRDSIITGAKIALTTIPGEDMAITGMTGDASRLVGAITGGNLDTVRVGSGLQLSSGELRADTAAMIIACSDETTNLTTGTAKVTFRAPFAFTILGVRASVKTAPTGANLIVDINEGDPPSATSIMTTNKLVIEATEKTSLDATTQPGITDTSIANDAVVTIDIDQIGSTAAGVALKVVILYRKN